MCMSGCRETNGVKEQPAEQASLEAEELRKEAVWTDVPLMMARSALVGSQGSPARVRKDFARPFPDPAIADHHI